MDKKKLKNELLEFRDVFKEYQSAVQSMWAERNHNGNLKEIQRIREELEIPLREQLTEKFGMLERYLRKMGVPMQAVWLGRTMPIFDTALDSKIFDNPGKGETLKMAVQMAIKAVGMAESIDEKYISRMDRKIPVVFVSYNFADKNKELASNVVSYLNTQGVSVLVGSEPTPNSVSEKVKRMIDDSEIVVGLMTADEKDAEGRNSASKWIRDELAYALANADRVVIRMIEEGCDTAGRIFGDREYILFNRDNFAPALIKLAQMLQPYLSP